MTWSRRIALVAAVLIIAAFGTLSAHDMFLRLPSFFLEPNSTATVALVNGTFEQSENAIGRDRITDVSVAGPDGVTHPPTSAWRDSAVHHESADSVDTAFLDVETGGPGTYVIGVSTAPRVFTLTAREFNDYLEHDGVLDVLEARREQDRLDEEATERYSKHVKAVVQVGGARSGTYARELGYPIEFVPLENPYELGEGDTLAVRLLREGRAVPDQLVYASHEGHARDAGAGAQPEAVETRTDREGVARIPLESAGRWYVRTIHMVETTEEPEVDYESNWATLTFQVR